MKARIHSYDDLKRSFGSGSRGRTLEVSSKSIVVQAGAAGLTLEASEWEMVGSAVDWQGPTFTKDYRRELTLELTPEDLKRIFDAALAAGLIRLTVSAPQAASLPD